MNFCPKCGTKALEDVDLGGIGHEFSPQPEYIPTRRFNRGYVRQRQVLEPVEPEASKQSTARPSHAIVEEVESNGIKYDEIPEAAKRILSRKEHYVVRYKLLEEQDAEYGKPVEKLPIDPELISLLKDARTNRLYKFQEEALNSILKRENAVITAPTGNGKTLAFAVPIFHLILEGKKGESEEALATTRALFIYPTKALARDQIRVLQKFIPERVRAAVFDGDTPGSERGRILNFPPDVLISNFDTIDYHLRNRTQYSLLFRDVQFVVVDEIHTYLGAFGSHVFYILRRLARTSQNRDRIQLIGSSATIRNAKQFAEQLFNRSVTEIRCDKGRRGRIHFIMLYPEKISMTSMIAGCVKVLLASEMKTLVFANTHKNAEVINLALRNDGVMSEIHRAGLLSNHRRDVEDSFKGGELKALVSTPTLELGIDIGDLDSVVSMITGITTLTQRMGRAGRKGQESVVVLALRNEDPISAFYKNHPETYFTDINPAYVEPNNRFISRLEIMAAAMDRAIERNEFTDQVSVIQELSEKGFLIEKSGRLWATSSAIKEVGKMNIRGIGETVTILDCSDEKNHKTIGERQMPMALRELFPDAVYLLAGRKYESTSFEFRGGVGICKVKQLPDKHPYKTEALRHGDPEIIRMLEKRTLKGLEVQYCDLKITEVMDGYVVKEIFSDRIVGPPRYFSNPLTYTYETKGLVFKAPKPSKLEISMMDKNPSLEEMTLDDVLAGSYHALEHALIESSDSLTGSGSSEIGGISMSPSGAIFVYDGAPGGSGLTKLLYDRLEEALERTTAILRECKCKSKNGCPICTHSYQCGNNNYPLCKSGAIDSLEQIAKSRGTTIDISEFTGEKSLL